MTIANIMLSIITIMWNLFVMAWMVDMITVDGATLVFVGIMAFLGSILSYSTMQSVINPVKKEVKKKNES